VKQTMHAIAAIALVTATVVHAGAAPEDRIRSVVGCVIASMPPEVGR
jgi:hypothetical protein